MRSDRDGYLRFNLYHKSKLVTVKAHSFVLECFGGLRPGMTVNHIDRCKSNNALANLEWMTAQENSSAAAPFRSINHRVVIDGVRYFSKREAQRRTGISRQSRRMSDLYDQGVA